ncbi:S-layer protein [Candidatus Woesearchaeota archaeon]|nr:S-layer protein [Candidatus Woesearchaeota archaeon]
MFVVQEQKGELSSLPAKEISPLQAKALTSKLARSILQSLAEESSYPKAIARKLNMHEQKIYYHIRKLEKAKLIEVTKTIFIGGTQAQLYSLTQPAFVILFTDFKTTQKISSLDKTTKAFFEPFIEEGQLKATLIVGSPDPHGPEKARSRDGYYGIDFALFLGTFLNYVPDLNVKLDTEVREEELTNNIILIGGPIVNTITGKINAKLSVYFDEQQNWSIHSEITKKTYHSDEAGIIVKTKNPFNQKKHCLVIAGKRHQGTRAVMIAFIKHFPEIIKGNKSNPKLIAKVVEGIDLNADGIVDDVEFLE